MRCFLFLFFFLFSVTSAYALDVSFEYKVLHAKPLADLVGNNPIPVVDTFFQCWEEGGDIIACNQTLQQAGAHRMIIPLAYFRNECAQTDNAANCARVIDHILSRNLLLATTYKNLAMGLGKYPDDFFGHGTLWAVYFASQDTIVGTLTALANKNQWKGPSYVKAEEKSKKETELDFLTLLADENQKQHEKISELVKQLAIYCRNENKQQCIKSILDYDRFSSELEQAIALLDAFAHPEENRRNYIRSIFNDLQVQLLELLSTYKPKK